MFGGFGAGELLIVLVFALIFIGPKKLPELAKGLGKGLREFQKAKDDLMDHVNDAAETNSHKEESVASQITESPDANIAAQGDVENENSNNSEDVKDQVIESGKTKQS
ncbi:MttA family protein [Bacteriovorax sp. BAL6_X]|uniref:twin-arginine translocase TatA/TatE family subunit n=1 Tax=Bacteriovorax sp. BAL6_X TaxID=1201290 RepID=UPI0003867E14|nr:twin-arginine translocase TatA/TatE family subunit [Bacteriovorax sp. BAL6_X]EPZ51309.1 MttA family protein [Bacteriovorax sp. BAL6_X]